MPKPFLTYEQQLVKLRDEKCIVIENESMTLSKLQQVGYYSLVSGYKHLFRIPAQKTYKGGTTFREIVALYEFDESLRELFLHYLLHIERHIRSLLSYYFTEKYGESQSAYLTKTNYNYARKHQQGIDRLVNDLQKLTQTTQHSYIAYQRNTYDIKWSERPIYVGIDSFGIGWIAADSSSHQLATKTASAVGEVSYCYASTGNSAGLSSSVDMDTSQSGGVVGTPVIINHQNTSTYGKHISGTVGVGTQSNSSNMETIQIFVAYAHSTVSVTFSADVALQWKQVGMSINFTPQKKTTIIARGNATFKYNGQGYQTAGTV